MDPIHTPKPSHTDLPFGELTFARSAEPDPAQSTEFDRVFAESQSTSVEDALQRLFEMGNALLSVQYERGKLSREEFAQLLRDRPTGQFGDLALTSGPGTAYLFSDLEGDLDSFRSGCIRNRIVERLFAADPADRVYLGVLGDTIDRGTQASKILEFLFHLKVRCGFFDQVIVLAGNHELEQRIQRGGQGGFKDEIVTARSAYRTSFDRNSEIIQQMFEHYYDMEWSSISYLTNSKSDFFRTAAEVVWGSFNAVFRLLPKYWGSSEAFFASHAGIPTRGVFSEIAQPQLVDTVPSLSGVDFLYELAVPDEAHSKANLEDVVWSDLDPYLEFTGANITRASREKIESGKPITAAGVSLGWGAIDRFLACGGWDRWLRGHQGRVPQHPDAVDLGDGVWRYRRALTVKSSQSNFGDVPTGGSCLEVSLSDPAKVTVHRL